MITPERVTRALYDALSVIVEDPKLRMAIEQSGDLMAIRQAQHARAVYETVYPDGLLPEVPASDVIPAETSKALDAAHDQMARELHMNDVHTECPHDCLTRWDERGEDR